ncbi:MAG TPA: family 16 glycoside hydrolase [Planctomycetaceae bacterium]|nr:family 16 glycoside hydrolase [Planctomycetaceae bacterium]
MPRSVVFGFCVLLFWLAHRARAEESATKPDPGRFEPLYNGRDLSGWKVKGGKLEAWKADGELLSGIGPEGGWLRTEKTYSDFVLRLEYRIVAGGNSGVGLRLPAEGAPAQAGLEIQVLDEAVPPESKSGGSDETRRNGAIVGHVAAEKVAAKPAGEWNVFEITCRGPQVKVVLNGETVIDVAVDTLKDDEKEGRTALADRPEVGFIGLQCSPAQVDFRKIELRDLVTKTNSGLQYVDVTEGTGAIVKAGGTVTVHYTGRLIDGRKFDSSRDAGLARSFPLSNLIKGWQEGVAGMKVTGRRKLIIPPELGYGDRGVGGVVPPGATLVFDVEVLEVE